MLPQSAPGRVRIETRRLDSLVPADYNPRSITSEALAGLGASIERFGLVQPVIVNERTGNVVGGHQRLKALAARGVVETDVVVVDLPDAEEKALNLALNSQAISGEWTGDALALLDEVAAQLPDLASALLLPDLREVIEDLFPEQRVAIEDEVPAPPDTPITKPGDLWALGAHRLLCGDSGRAKDLDRLLAGAPVHMVHTDPPYNVNVEPRSNNAIASGTSPDVLPHLPKHHQKFDLARHPGKSKGTTKKMRAKDRHLQNDCVSDEAFAALLLAWFGNLARVLLPGRAFYVWGGYANVANYPPALKATGLRFAQSIIWHKQHPVLGRKDFMGDHEWCFYGWREGAAHQFYGPNNVPDVWPIKKVTPTKMVHLTEKPVALGVRAMECSSKSGEHVLDLFGGSGSTLIAAEQTDRRGFLMEIDPAYADVIVQRYEAFSGKKAERVPS